MSTGGGACEAGATRVRRIEGRGVPLRGDDIDTDRIIPARFLRCVTFDGIGEHAFEDDRAATAGGRHPLDREEFQGAEILVVNRNFGCGSSREHAPQSLMRWGFRALLGESFAEIFFGNCVALGIPCGRLSGADIAWLQDSIEKDPRLSIAIDLEAGAARAGDRELPLDIPPGAREAFSSGTWDSAGLLLDRPEEIDRVAGTLPYLAGWGRPA